MEQGSIAAGYRHVTVELNDVKIVDANLEDHKDQFDKHPGLKWRKGTSVCRVTMVAWNSAICSSKSSEGSGELAVHHFDFSGDHHRQGLAVHFPARVGTIAALDLNLAGVSMVHGALGSTVKVGDFARFQRSASNPEHRAGLMVSFSMSWGQVRKPGSIKALIQIGMVSSPLMPLGPDPARASSFRERAAHDRWQSPRVCRRLIQR